MKSLIAFLIVLSTPPLSAQYFSKKDTLRFAPDSSYSRVIIRHEKKLLFGTSNNGVMALDERSKAATMIIPPSPAGEFRGLAVDKYGIYGVVSGDNGEIWRKNAVKTERIARYDSVFLDDIKSHGDHLFLLGDPHKGHFVLEQLNTYLLIGYNIHSPEPGDAEACYAASATTLLVPNDSTILFISGGKQDARFHQTKNLGRTWHAIDLPMTTGEGCGPFSMCFTDKQQQNGIIAGGCYTDPNNANGTSVYTTDGGHTWHQPEKPTRGYRSCVTGNKKIQFACGTTGIDISRDGGKTWEAFDDGNFCALLLEKKVLYATTNKGYCIRYKLK